MECGGCTMCCLLLNIKETKSIPSEYCKHCNPSVGCKIYENRPESCRIFECAWKQMVNAHIDLRPDNCKVLFEKWSDKVIVGATVEKDITQLVLNQINYFRGEGISVLMINHRDRIRQFFLAPTHSKDFVRKEIRNSIKNDSTKLY